MATRGRLEGRITVTTAWTATVGAGTATIAAGTYYGKAFLAVVAAAFATAAGTSCTITGGLGENGTGLVTITFGSTKAISWVDTDLRDILGFTGNLTTATSHVSPNHMRGVWLPNCHYQAPNPIGESYQGWREADVRSAGNRAGYQWHHVGAQKVAVWLSWPQVLRAKTWMAHETTTNASAERFWRDCIWGETGWGTPSGPIRFFPDAADDAVYADYRVVDAATFNPAPSFDGWQGGPHAVKLPRLVALPVTTEPEIPWTLPDDAVEWVATFPSIVTPDSIWPMQDTALPAVDTVGSADLDTYNGSGDEPVQQTGDPLSRFDIFLEDVQSHIRASSNSVHNITTGDFSIFFRFMVDAAETPASGHHLARKKSSTANTDGWAIKFSGTGGELNLVFDTPSSTQSDCAQTVSVDDGGWHFCLAVIDRTGGALHLYTELEHVTVSISAHAGGSATNTAIFGFGDTQGNLNAAAKVHYSYAACWVGTALTAADFDILSDA